MGNAFELLELGGLIYTELTLGSTNVESLSLALNSSLFYRKHSRVLMYIYMI